MNVNENGYDLKVDQEEYDLIFEFDVEFDQIGDLNLDLKRSLQWSEFGVELDGG